MPKFQAQIKQFSIKSLVTGDAEVEIKLRGRLDKDNFKKLVDIYNAQSEVIIKID